MRARPVALTLYNDPEGDRAFMLHLDKQEAARRAAATSFVCHAVAMGLEEGADMVATRMLEPILGWAGIGSERLRLFEPSYTFIRNFLIGELDADPILAATVAMDRIRMRNRTFRHRDCGGERGWL